MRRWQLVGIVVGVAACAKGAGDHPADAPAADARPDARPDAAPDARVDARPDACVPTTEVCDGVDNDCDGTADEGFPVGQACSTGLGACATSGTFACDGSGSFACSAVAADPTPEICGDGIDQDCTGGDAVCPANDRPAGAIDISAGGTFTADLSAAHDDDTSACSPVGGRDVYYTLTLPAAEVVYLDTFGSTFASVIHMTTGACTAAPLAEQACAASACGQPAGQIAMQFAAGTYCVVVDQAASDDTATANGPGAAVLHVVRGGRTGVAIANTDGSASGDTTGHADQTTPETACEKNSHQPDDGYFFTTCPGATQTVGASTCGGATDTIIYLRTGSAKSTSVACDDDGCQTSAAGPFTSVFTGATVTGANVHWLIVDGFGSGTSGKGAYTLTWTIQ